MKKMQSLLCACLGAMSMAALATTAVARGTVKQAMDYSLFGETSVIIANSLREVNLREAGLAMPTTLRPASGYANIAPSQTESRKDKEMTRIEMFAAVGIPDPERRYDAYPHELSGGLRQRVMIAMAMICKPKLLIADEPTTALDVTVEAQILELMEKLREGGTSILLISHNLGVIARMCEDVYVMYAGKIVEHAEIGTLFADPAHPYTKGLLRAVTSLQEETALLETIPGNVPQLYELPPGCRFSNRCAFATERCRADEPALRDLGGRECACFLEDRA